MEQQYIQLYDEFTHSTMSRREFMDKLTEMAGSAGAAALLPLLQNNYAHAQIVPAADTRIETSTISYPGAEGKAVSAYLAKPKGAGQWPAVVMIHENRGLNPHIQDVARRLALEGFVVLPVDGLSPLGGTPADEDQARELIGKLDMAATRTNYVAAIPYLKSRAEVTGKVGCVGFCWGGSMANQMAVLASDLSAAVAYYGGQAKAEEVPSIQASLMLHYAGLDTRINAGIAAYESALKAAQKDYQIFIYPDVNHAFNNDTNAARYNAEAAQLAWKRTVDFLKGKLT